MQALEIEIDGPANEALYFAPLQRSIRGRFDLAREKTPAAILEAQKWPSPIPSQRLGLTPEGKGFISEPLHGPDFAVHRERIEKLGLGRLEPAVVEFADVDVVSWQFWMMRAVESGIARLTRGKFPEKLEGTPRLNYILAEQQPNPTLDRLATAIERQSLLFEKLLERLDSKQ